MKILKIKFVDFWDGFDFNSNFIVDVLSMKYKVVLSDDPDYLFFSCFGVANLSYTCVKILFIGENLVPDFNICDYALGFDYLSFGDRYMRFPLYVTYASFKNIEKEKGLDEEKLLNRQFCSVVVSNTAFADPYREQIFKLLSEYKKVDSGGRSWNNIGAPVVNKYKFISEYKFNIAFENSSILGYTTEKIMEPMSVNSIPIYWGNPMIGKEFNLNSFVNAHEFGSLEDLVENIVKLDSSDDEYLKKLREPWIIDRNVLLLKERLLEFLSNIVDKPLCEAKYLVAYGRLEIYRKDLIASNLYINKPKGRKIDSLCKKIISKIKKVL